MYQILLDEGLSPLAAQILRDEGIDTLHVKEVNLTSAPDDAILNFARRQNRTIFTLDHDFHQILALSREQLPSVVLLRFDHLKAAEAAPLRDAQALWPHGSITQICGTPIAT